MSLEEIKVEELLNNDESFSSVSHLDRSDSHDISLLHKKKYDHDAMEMVPLNFMPAASSAPKKSEKDSSEASSILLQKQSVKIVSQEPNAGDLESLKVQETRPKSRILIVDDEAINVIFLKLQLQ